MCIAFFQWTEDRFLVCHNRDEVFSRPTTNTGWWNNNNNTDDDADNNDGFEILAPRDVVSGGTWFGFEKTTGRCAFLTNIRELNSTKYSSSRGEFVVNYLKSDKSLSALEYLCREFGNGDSTTGTPSKEYAGFNLVVFSGRDLAYFSNRYPEDEPRKGPIALSIGTAYGLSNSTLQEPYAKVRKGLTIFDQILAKHPRTDGDGTSKDDDDDDDDDDENDSQGANHLMEDLEKLMQRTEYCPGDPLPRTGEPGFPESVVKARSSICVPSLKGYGTRTTIRFLLERRRQVEETKDGSSARQRDSSQWQLRCVEKNWNTETLEWEKSMGLNCSISL